MRQYRIIMTEKINRALYQIEKLVEQGKDRIAVFDMDNTLLKGDIGEAVHIRLLQTKEMNSFKWKDYLDLLKDEGVLETYLTAVKELKGLSKSQIIDTTKYVLDYEDNIFHHHENNLYYEILVPKPNESMIMLINELKKYDFKSYVISASNDISVKYTAEKLFGISPEYAFGVASLTNGDELLTDAIIKPSPVLEGKAELINKLLGKKKPIFAAGDSYNDLAMFNTVDNDGFILWMGKDQKQLEKVKSHLNSPKYLIID